MPDVGGGISVVGGRADAAAASLRGVPDDLAVIKGECVDGAAHCTGADGVADEPSCHLIPCGAGSVSLQAVGNWAVPGVDVLTLQADAGPEDGGSRNVSGQHIGIGEPFPLQDAVLVIPHWQV